MEAIVRSVAEERGREPADLQPIAGTGGPEAIESLYDRATAENQLTVSFQYGGCRVTDEPNAVAFEALRPTPRE